MGSRGIPWYGEKEVWSFSFPSGHHAGVRCHHRKVFREHQKLDQKHRGGVSKSHDCHVTHTLWPFWPSFSECISRCRENDFGEQMRPARVKSGRHRERESGKWVWLARSCDESCDPVGFLFFFLQLAEEHGVKFMETSAKSGLNVETVSLKLYSCWAWNLRIMYLNLLKLGYPSIQYSLKPISSSREIPETPPPPLS